MGEVCELCRFEVETGHGRHSSQSDCVRDWKRVAVAHAHLVEQRDR